MFTFAAGRTVVATEAEFWLLDDYCSEACLNTFYYILRPVTFQKQAVNKSSVFSEEIGILAGLG
jgi:hypothetical protein